MVATLLLVSVRSPADLLTPTTSAATKREFYEGLQKCHDVHDRGLREPVASASRANPRWNPVAGQKEAIVIQNATLFDGESTLDDRVDIIFDAGVIRSVLPTSQHTPLPANAQVIDVHGSFVTPGLVDMHSHHLLLSFPQLPATKDVNESPLLGPLTSFVRAVDGFNPDDPAIKIIASGGVTSSLIPPGSANVIGGEAYLVKNLLRPGPDGEPVIEELLLDHGIPEAQRQRYLKMACGENPRRFYGHTRLGLAWLLREELNKARELHARQTEWCQAAFQIEESRVGQSQQIANFIDRQGKRPEEFKLETLVALLRGELNLNVHCYTPDDLERMLAVLHEFGVHPRAFHHALSAWQVPEFLKHLEECVASPLISMSQIEGLTQVGSQKHHYCHVRRQRPVQGRGLRVESARAQDSGRARSPRGPEISESWCLSLSGHGSLIWVSRITQEKAITRSTSCEWRTGICPNPKFSLTSA